MGDVKHGTNPGARRLQEQQSAVLGMVDDTPAICPYDHHRPTDWRLAEGHIAVCGVCHPPAAGLEVVRLHG
jgi:hypothetical protein